MKKPPKHNKDGRERPFICKSEKALVALKTWLKTRAYCNIINDKNDDRLGQPIINISYKSVYRATSDWGRAKTHGIIVCSDRDMRAKAVKICKKHFGEDINAYLARAEKEGWG